ncbi:hypothetical protein ACA910_022448 [Epithemia clementina (nom. ined.)]
MISSRDETTRHKQGQAQQSSYPLVPRRSDRLQSVRNTKKQKLEPDNAASNTVPLGNGEDSSSSSSSLITRIGILADIQYAPIPDGYSYSGSSRYYRFALEAAQHAAQQLEQEKVDLVVNLGDIVDGKCQSIATNGGIPLPDVDEYGRTVGEQCVDHVLAALSPYKFGTILHTYGNHCLYNMDRPLIQRKLNIPFVQEPCGDLVGYYSYKRTAENGTCLRFVVLDTYDISLMQRCPQQSQKRQDAVQLLQSKNPNYPKLENSPDGLNGMAQRFVAFNGGVGPLQLQWLQQTLDQARQNGEMVVILSHQPILPGSSKPICLVWNYNDVLRVLRQYRDVVAASLAGHAHKGGYKRDDKSGIHFRVMEAVLENSVPTYALVAIHDDQIEVQGFGNCESAVYKLDHLTIHKKKNDKNNNNNNNHKNNISYNHLKRNDNFEDTATTTAVAELAQSNALMSASD